MPSRHPAIANEIGQRIAELLACEPSACWARADELAVPASAVRSHILRDDIPHALGIAAMASYSWYLRINWQACAIDPECFAVDYADDCLPAGVHDVRALPMSAVSPIITVEALAA